MSLATRCTSCGTIFRVVQDQLRVSDGWVRCGRCEEVFNASADLFDLENEARAVQRPAIGGASADFRAPPPNETEPAATDEWAAALSAGSSPADESPPGKAVSPAWDVEAPASLSGASEPIPARRSQDVPVESWLGPGDQTPAEGVNVRDRNEFADARFNTDLLGDELIDTPAPMPAAKPGVLVETAERVGVAASVSNPAEIPNFLKEAERQARRRQPGVRAAYFAATLLLGVGLVMQVVHHSRDLVAELLPQSASLLTAWCGAVNCTLETPRRISNLTVDNTAISRTTAGSEAVRLSVTLRNHGGFAVALPSVDLSLTDANGQLIVRRVLSPGDFGATSRRIAGGSEVPLQLHLSAGGRRISGYTIEIFYP